VAAGVCKRAIESWKRIGFVTATALSRSNFVSIVDCIWLSRLDILCRSGRRQRRPDNLELCKMTVLLVTPEHMFICIYNIT